jgi:signal peptidase I
MTPKSKRKRRQDPAAADPAPKGAASPPEKSIRRSAVEWMKSIVIALVIWFLLKSLLIEAFRIPSGSMENTLLIGDVLFVNKALYGAEIPVVHRRLPAIREPQRGDLVIFESVEEPGLTVVKRIIGVPGDTIWMEDDVVHVTDRALDEPYVVRTDSTGDLEDPRMRAWQVRYLVARDTGAYRPTLKNWGPLEVPPDSFMVMGDNRNNSLDSRYWGFLGRDRIHGRPLFIYYSYDKNGLLPLPFFTAIRWGRILSRPH